MPIVEIKTIQTCPRQKLEQLPDCVSGALSKALGWGEERFVVCAEASLDPATCKFNGVPAVQLTGRKSPCLIRISAAWGKPEEQENLIIRTVASAAAQALELPVENVTVCYQRVPEKKLFANGRFL